MNYLADERALKRRSNPLQILPECQSILSVAVNYFPGDRQHAENTPRVAAYAQGDDYHDILIERLEQLAGFIEIQVGGSVPYRKYTDTGPLLEREFAQRSGLGWIGKNTMLIHPRRGSFFFLASVLTDLDLAVDAPFKNDRCGSCRRCLNACPTGAFPAERVLDSRRCISYLTIEYRSDIPEGLRPSMGRWVFGCDVCQDVCPWNVKFATPAQDRLLQLDPSMEHLDLASLATVTDEDFDRAYGATPLARPGAPGMRRNAEIARANELDPAPPS